MKMMLIDTSFLAYQAAFKLGSLQKDDTLTGVIYGVLMRVLTMGTQFRTNDFHFCFDSSAATGVRRQACPTYKISRNKTTPEEQEERRLLYSQIDLLRDCVEAIGWPCYEEEGFESDDIIASLSRQHQHALEIVIVSADGDLYQLLDHPNVSMFNPTKHARTYAKDLPYRPDQVAMLKAIGGCSSDEIKGVGGVGEKRALEYLNDTWNKLKKPKWVETIESSSAVIKANLELTKLPHAKMKPAQEKEKNINAAGFREVCRSLGFESFSSDSIMSRWANLFNGEFDNLERKSNVPMGRVSQRRASVTSTNGELGI